MWRTVLLAAALSLAPTASISQTTAPSPQSPESAPDSAAPQPATVTQAPFTGRPGARDFARHYPARAREEGVEGSATIECLVGADGRLDCAVIAEEPPGYGFGEATLLVAREFRVAPQTRDGIPTVGGRIRRTIRWLLPR